MSLYIILALFGRTYWNSIPLARGNENPRVPWVLRSLRKTPEKIDANARFAIMLANHVIISRSVFFLLSRRNFPKVRHYSFRIPDNAKLSNQLELRHECRKSAGFLKVESRLSYSWIANEPRGEMLSGHERIRRKCTKCSNDEIRKSRCPGKTKVASFMIALESARQYTRREIEKIEQIRWGGE